MEKGNKDASKRIRTVLKSSQSISRSSSTLAGAFTTLPEFLCDRFDDDVRRMTVVLFMVGYGLVTIPGVLYSGSIAVLQLFDVPSLLSVSYSTGLAITIIGIGCIGALYAIFGGLRAVAVSDTLNGIGLLIVGTAVPLLGFSALLTYLIPLFAFLDVSKI